MSNLSNVSQALGNRKGEAMQDKNTSTQAPVPASAPAGEGAVPGPDLRMARPEIAALHAPALAVDIEEAGRLVGVCCETIRREIMRGNLRAFKIGRVWRVRISELLSYLKRLEAKNERQTA